MWVFVFCMCECVCSKSVCKYVSACVGAVVLLVFRCLYVFMYIAYTHLNVCVCWHLIVYMKIKSTRNYEL